MTENEVLVVLKHIVDSDEKCATDVMYALSLLSTNTEKMLESIKQQMREHLNSNRFDEITKLTDYCNLIMELNKQIELCITTLIRDSVNTQKAIANNTVPSTKIDYSQYCVDRRESHTLAEDFEHKKICAFRVNDLEFNVQNWKDTLLKLCELVGKQSIKLLEGMVENPDFTGKKNTYFLKYYVPGRNERIPGTDIFVWTNLSANDIVKLIKKILHYLHIPEENFIVFLRADYSELHQD